MKPNQIKGKVAKDRVLAHEEWWRVGSAFSASCFSIFRSRVKAYEVSTQFYRLRISLPSEFSQLL
jgi:hypothetical protein